MLQEVATSKLWIWDPMSSTRARICGLPGCSRAVRDNHDYCGRTHAREALALNGRELKSPEARSRTCALSGCGKRVYYDPSDDRLHDYCCRAHAQEALALGERRSALRFQGVEGPVGHRCALSGCTAPRYVDPATGREFDYCGRRHAKLAAEVEEAMSCGACAEEEPVVVVGLPVGMPA